jgi:hypothetical protein
LSAHRTNAGNGVVEVVGIISYNLCVADEGLRLGEVRETVVKVSSNPKELFAAVNVFAEVNVVHLINVTFVHVTSEHELGDCLWCCDFE